MSRTLGLWVAIILSAAADWPQWGGSSARNNTPDGANIPIEWNVGQFEPKSGRWLGDSAKNIRWVARLGTTTYGTPVVADAKVFCATNNGAGWLKRYPPKVDLGCLLSFRQSDGQFIWQLSCEKLPGGRAVDYPEQGICCSPLVEGKRLWIVTNRCAVVCLDTEGFEDGRNEGPYKVETSTAAGEADIVWTFDMMHTLGVRPHNMTACSVTTAGDLLLVGTSNGTDEGRRAVLAPQAPSFIALNKHTGKLVWSDNTPAANVLDGQWASPAVGTLGGVRQAIFPGGDGWLYGFRAEITATGEPELLWKFDCNPKTSVWKADGSGDRNNIIASPLIHEGRVYIATGDDPEFGEGIGGLWCLDLGTVPIFASAKMGMVQKRGLAPSQTSANTRKKHVMGKVPVPFSEPCPKMGQSPSRGALDVSPQLVVDRSGKAVSPRRLLAIDSTAGETVRRNPNSAEVWRYTGFDANGDGKLDFEETMHRSISTVAIKDGLLVTADIAGLVHCLDANTGKVHWTYDLKSPIWGSPCLVEDRIYLGTQDGDVAVFELSAKPKLLSTNAMQQSVYSTPVVVGEVMYIATSTHLFAIAKPNSSGRR